MVKFTCSNLSSICDVDFVYTMHLLRFYMVDIFLLHLDITIAYPTVSVMHVNQ